MVWVFRIGLGALIATYAGWLIWPVLQPLMQGGGLPDAVATVTAEAGRLGWGVPTLWLGASCLYLVAGVLTAARIGAAPGAYFLAFGAEVIQRVMLQTTAGGGPTDTPGRIAEALRPVALSVDPAPLALAVLLAVGLLVVMTGVWRGQKGQALTRDWTQPPIYA